MGCFNMKCALTQLPITSGDDVVMLFGYRPGNDEKRKDYAGGFNYQVHHFKLVSTPIYGKYNDYGWVEDADPVSVRVNAEVFKVMGFDISFDVENAHWNNVIDSMGGPGYSRWSSKQGGDRFYDYTVIHRQAWDALLAASQKYTPSIFYHFTLEEPMKSSFASVFASHGGRIRYNEYNKKSTQVFCTPHNEFAAIIELLTSDIPLRGTGVDEHDLAREMRELGVEIITSILDKSSENRTSKEQELLSRYTRMVLRSSDQSSVANPALAMTRRLFEWMGPLTDPSTAFGGSGSLRDEFGGKLWNLERANAIIRLCASDIDVFDAMQELYGIYAALCANQLTIRGQEDLPTQSQESTHWGSIAIIKASMDVLYNHATKWDDWGDDEVSRENQTKQEVIDELADKGLDCSY